LYFQNGRPVFSYTVADGSILPCCRRRCCAGGKAFRRDELRYDGGGMGKSGTATVLVDGTEVAKICVLKTTPFRFSTEETLDFGEDTGTPDDMFYDVPFKFTGELGKIVIDLK
jgi:hypothetical protein